MKYVVRGVVFVAGLIGMIVIVGVGFIWISAYRALPPLEGTLTVAGVAAPITIARDERAIPLITAASEDDAYFALGYVHAQERLFQMELMRRQGQGRLAEIIGSLGGGPDRQMRTLGVYGRAEADFKGLDPATQRAFERYADGVNAWLSQGHPLPLEFAILHFTPEPWRTADSLVWQKLMGSQLSGNWSQELLQAALVTKLGAERAARLTPGPKPSDPVTVTQHAALYEILAPARLLAEMTDVIRPTTASNVWAIGGSRTQSGKPILASDPHLGFQAPITWYLAGIDTPTLKVFGATVPGVPLHMLGHTQHVAWGLTTPESDTADLFIERLAADGNSYETPEGPKALEQRTEIIRVRFGDPVAVTVRETRHGPVVSDILQTRGGGLAEEVPSGHVLALSAALLQSGDRTADGVFGMNHAGSAAAFLEAIKLFHAPHQNVMFADTAGAIGYYAPGRVPMRKAGNGTVPVPGWTGDYDWTGWIPFEALPQDLDPAGGLLINANNKMVRDDYPYLIAAEWRDSYRAARIAELIATAMPATVAGSMAAQQDVVSLAARDMLPLLRARLKPRDERDRNLLARLEAWDGTMDRSRSEPLIFTLWMEKLKTALLADDLGELYNRFGGARPELMHAILTQDGAWCDDIRTQLSETCDDQVAAAWAEAVAWIDAHSDGDINAVRWGDFHVGSFGHLFFQNVPGIGRFGALSIATGGDSFTVNRGSHALSTSPMPFRHFHGPSFRAVYDLSDLAESRFSLPGGQSGHLASPHYGDLLENWRDGTAFAAPRAATATQRLILEPLLLEPVRP